MANKRILKKQIRHICGDLAVEAAIAIHMIPDINTGVMNDVIVSVADLQSNTLQKMSFSFDKVAHDFDVRTDYNKAKSDYNKAAYKKLIKTFNTSVREIVKKMNEALPEAQKLANKAALNDSEK